MVKLGDMVTCFNMFMDFSHVFDSIERPSMACHCFASLRLQKPTSTRSRTLRSEKISLQLVPQSLETSGNLLGALGRCRDHHQENNGTIWDDYGQ